LRKTTLLARIAHSVPNRKPNDPVQDQSRDGQVKQQYQEVKRGENHTHPDLALSTSPSVHRTGQNATVAYGMWAQQEPAQAEGGVSALTPDSTPHLGGEADSIPATLSVSSL
jgi:hypothetical protein